jgi:hypothetical protein
MYLIRKKTLIILFHHPLEEGDNELYLLTSSSIFKSNKKYQIMKISPSATDSFASITFAKGLPNIVKVVLQIFFICLDIRSSSYDRSRCDAFCSCGFFRDLQIVSASRISGISTIPDLGFEYVIFCSLYPSLDPGKTYFLILCLKSFLMWEETFSGQESAQPGTFLEL